MFFLLKKSYLVKIATLIGNDLRPHFENPHSVAQRAVFIVHIICINSQLSNKFPWHVYISVAWRTLGNINQIIFIGLRSSKVYYENIYYSRFNADFCGMRHDPKTKVRK